jgi:hypothetical protein
LIAPKAKPYLKCRFIICMEITDSLEASERCYINQLMNEMNQFSSPIWIHGLKREEVLGTRHTLWVLPTNICRRLNTSWSNTVLQ